jgi:hypothetical protein
MANLTDPMAIPAAKRDTIKAVLVQHGPRLAESVYPTEDDGNGNQVPKTVLTNEEAATVFEHVTRRFWRDHIAAYEASQAAEAARQTALDDNVDDPWAELP